MVVANVDLCQLGQLITGLDDVGSLLVLQPAVLQIEVTKILNHRQGTRQGVQLILVHVVVPHVKKAFDLKASFQIEFDSSIFL